jgi:hypothetical protein
MQRLASLICPQPEPYFRATRTPSRARHSSLVRVRALRLCRSAISREMRPLAGGGEPPPGLPPPRADRSGGQRPPMSIARAPQSGPLGATSAACQQNFVAYEGHELQHADPGRRKGSFSQAESDRRPTKMVLLDRSPVKRNSSQRHDIPGPSRTSCPRRRGDPGRVKMVDDQRRRLPNAAHSMVPASP